MPPDSDGQNFWLQLPVARAFAVSCAECRFNDPREYRFAPDKLQKHEGLDLAATDASGQPVAVLAAQRGVVDRVGFSADGYGHYVRIVHEWHDGTYVTWYGHLSQTLVQEGRFVSAGQQIGVAGSTGFSSGVHLHLTLQHLGQGLPGYVVDDVVDPLPFLRLDGPLSMKEASWLADVTVADGTVLQPGQQFVKTWRVRNSGNVSWDNGYRLSHVEGSRLNGPGSVPLPRTAPGEAAEVSVTLTAPSRAGAYRSVWQPRDAQGNLFNFQMFTEIVVVAAAQLDEAGWVADVTVADGATVQPGQTFLKTWRVRNTGTTTWDAGYRLAFFNHERMGAPESVPLPPAAPGQEVDVSVTLRAPQTPGVWRSTWKPRTPQGLFFDHEQYAEIFVPRAIPPTQQVDEARYVADVTIEDGTLVQAGQPFTKTWRVRNSGTTAWGAGYELAFFDGERLSAPPAVPLPAAAPGQTVDVSVVLTAPQAAGMLRSTWKPRNAAGQFFDFELYAEIRVAQGVSPSQELDEARFVEDVTIADGTVVQAGRPFVKTWRLRNSGTTTWDDGYVLAFLGDKRMGGPASTPLGRVEPGQVVDISLTLTAPTVPGRHRSTWKPRNGAGQFFDFELFAEIEVATPAAPGGRNGAQLVEHVTVPEGTILLPGQTFVKTWRLRNSGTSAWGAGYTVAFAGDEQMGGPESAPLTATEPQRATNVSLTLTAPMTAGEQRGTWRVREPGGALFGDALPVVIRVTADAQAIDLLPYLRGDGRIYVLRYEWGGGGQQQVQTQHEGNRFFHAKGHEWEELWADESFIYRGTDTSPGNGNYYTLSENGAYGSPWIPRRVTPMTFFRRNPTVTFRRKADCQQVASFSHATWIALASLHESLTLGNGRTLRDVVELVAYTEEQGRRADAPFEHYFYARDYGLVAWRGAGVGESYLHEELPAGTPSIARERIPCLGR